MLVEPGFENEVMDTISALPTFIIQEKNYIHIHN